MSNLTEQWKKGELEEGEYWCKITESPYVERVYLPCCDDIIVEVLAPVPSYEEWQKVLNIDFNNEVLRLENQQLKELLYKCKEKLDWLNGGYVVWGGELTDFIEEIDNAIGEK